MSLKKRIAIIPARGGSKRITKKNIKEFNGFPLIKYSIDAAIKSEIFDRIIVSTDDTEIAEISIKYGAEVPFFRSKETSDDYSTLGDVIHEALVKIDLDEIKLDYVCCILPTAPFITKEFLKRAENIFLENSYDSLFPAAKYSYPIWRSLRKNTSSNNFEMVWPEHINTRSQDLEQIYHDAGMFYFLNTASFLEKKSVFLKNNGCILTAPWFVQDIDDEHDWEHAEIKYNLLEKQNKKLI